MRLNLLWFTVVKNLWELVRVVCFVAICSGVYIVADIAVVAVRSVVVVVASVVIAIVVGVVVLWW